MNLVRKMMRHGKKLMGRGVTASYDRPKAMKKNTPFRRHLSRNNGTTIHATKGRTGLNVKTDGGFEVPGRSIGRGIANLFGVVILMGVALAALTACVLPFVFIALVLS